MTNAIRTNGAMASPRKWGTGVAVIWIAITIIKSTAASGQAQPAPATLPSAMTWEQVVEQMNLNYAPREGEVIRLIPPPLSEVRNEWLRRNRNPGDLEMVMMVWRDGALTGRIYGSGGHYLPSVRDMLGFQSVL